MKNLVSISIVILTFFISNNSFGMIYSPTHLPFRKKAQSPITVIACSEDDLRLIIGYEDKMIIQCQRDAIEKFGSFSETIKKIIPVASDQFLICSENYLTLVKNEEYINIKGKFTPSCDASLIAKIQESDLIIEKYIYNKEANQPLATSQEIQKIIKGIALDIKQLEFSPNQQYLALQMSHCINIIDINSNNIVSSIPIEYNVFVKFCFSENNIYLFVQNNENEINKYAIESNKFINKFSSKENINCFTVSRDGTYLIAGLNNKKIVAFNMNSKDYESCCKQTFNCSCLKLTPDEEVLIAGFENGAIKMFNFAIPGKKESNDSHA